MRPVWDDVIARVRGLRTHLLTRETLRDLARESRPAGVAHRLAQAGYQLDPGAASAGSLELAIRRTAAGRMGTLARWCRARTAVLRVVFEDEDRRSLRQILRGMVDGSAPDLRLAGLIPTPALPERALEELARCDTVASAAALLTAWGHPAAPVLLAAGAARRPALLPLEVALTRRFAGRALAAARKDGTLRGFVREGIDLENVWTAAVLAGNAPDLDPASCFVPGGARITPQLVCEAAALPDAGSALRRLAAELGRTRLAQALLQAADRPWDIEQLVLAAREQDQIDRMRLMPLSLAPVLSYVLGVRLEVMALQRIIWGAELGAPGAARLLEEALV